MPQIYRPAALTHHRVPGSLRITTSGTDFLSLAFLSTDLISTGDFTMMCWARLQSTAATPVVMGVNASDLAVHVNASYNTTDASYDVWNDRAQVAGSGPNLLAISTWRHLALRYNGNTQIIDLFVDGVSTASSTTVVFGSVGSAGTIYFGFDGSAGMTGNIACCKLWVSGTGLGGLLSPAEINNERFEAGPVRKQALFAHLVPSDPYLGGRDYSGKNNNFTVNGSPRGGLGAPTVAFRYRQPAVRTKLKTVVTLSETDTLTEARATVFAAKATGLAESETLTEARASKFAALATLSETDTLTEARATLFRSAVSVSETDTLTEARATLFRSAVSVSETDTLTEAASGKQGAVIGLSEAETLAEARASVFGGHATLTEAATLAEVQTSLMRAVLPLSDSLALTEVLRAGQKFTTTLSEAVVLTEGLTPRLAAFFQVLDAMLLDELVIANGGAPVGPANLNYVISSRIPPVLPRSGYPKRRL